MTNTAAGGDDFLDSIFQGIQLPPVKFDGVETTEVHHEEHHHGIVQEHHGLVVHHEDHHYEHHHEHRVYVAPHEELEHHDHDHHEHEEEAHEEAHHDEHHEHHHHGEDEHHHHHEEEPALEIEPEHDADTLEHHHLDQRGPHVTAVMIGEGVAVDEPEHILHKSEEIEHHALTDEEEHHDHDHHHEQTASDAHGDDYETQEAAEDFFDRPAHTLAFENGIDEGDLADSEQSSDHIPHKHSGHDQVLEELKKRQIAQAIEEHAGDAESEPGTFHTETVPEQHGVKDVDGNTSQVLGSDDETLHASEHDLDIESDSDVQPVKAIQYQFDSDAVYKVKRTIKAKDNFQHELAETVRRRSENDEHVQEIKRAVENFDREQELAATRPFSLQIANYGYDEDEHDHHDRHHQHEAPKPAPVEPKRRTSLKNKEQQQRERHDSDREVVVHTPLHDTIGRYSSFEPDRQETVRKEIGHALNIRDLMGHFENKKTEQHAPRPWSRRPLHELVFEDQQHDDDYHHEQHLHEQHHHEVEAPKSRTSTLVKDKSRASTLVKDHHHEEHVTPTAPLSPVAVTAPHHHHHHHDDHHHHANGHHAANGTIDLSNSEIVLEEQKPVNELRSKFGHRVGAKQPTPVHRTKSNEQQVHEHRVEENGHDHHHHAEQHVPAKKHVEHTPTVHVAANHNHHADDHEHHKAPIHEHHDEQVHADHHHHDEDHHHHNHEHAHSKKFASAAPPVAHNITHESKGPSALPNFYTHSYLKEPFQSTRSREPPIGSVAAIHKSLSSIPTTPTTPPATPLNKEPEAEELQPFPSRSFGTTPRNVREFYKLWGRQPQGQQAAASKQIGAGAQLNGHSHHHHHEHEHHGFNSLPRTTQLNTA